MEYIVIDIGATKTLFALIRKTFSKIEILKTKKVLTLKSRYFMIEHLRQLDVFIKENDINNFKLRYSVCGPVKNNKIISLPNLDILELDLKKYVEGFFSKKINVRVENDVNCFALGIDNIFKSQIKKESLFCLNLGTGIGGSYINNRKLIVGKNGRFAEIGREIFKGKIRENFFQETLNLIHKLRIELISRNNLKIDSFKDYLELIKKYKLENNQTIKKIDKFFFENLLELITSIQNLYDPEHIVIGGSLVYYLEYLLKKDDLKYLNVKKFNKLKNTISYLDFTTTNYNILGAMFIKK